MTTGSAPKRQLPRITETVGEVLAICGFSSAHDRLPHAYLKKDQIESIMQSSSYLMNNDHQQVFDPTRTGGREQDFDRERQRAFRSARMKRNHGASPVCRVWS